MFFEGGIQKKNLDLILSFKNRGKYCINSKDVCVGDVFFALKGEKTDGHNYLKEVAEKGAKLAVVDKIYSGSSYGLNLCAVEDVLQTMQDAAKLFLSFLKGKVVGITGSVGKTTIKEFFVDILSERFLVGKNPKSFNSQRSLPISALNLKKNIDIAVLEMGMSMKGEMGKLADIVKPEIALINRVGLVHSVNFNGLEEIIYEKSRIFTKETKIKIIHSSLLKPLEAIGFNRKDFITYSVQDEKADYFLEQKGKGLFVVKKEGGEKEFYCPFSESHLLEDLLASYALADRFMEFDEIKNKIGELKPATLRFEKDEINKILFIKDCYNANALSTIAALENLPEVEGKKIAVLGSMAELGSYTEEAHKTVGKVASEKVDVILCLGRDCRFLIDSFKDKKNAFLFDDMKKLSEKLSKIMKEGDLVLVKGSRSHYLEKLFDFLVF